MARPPASAASLPAKLQLRPGSVIVVRHAPASAEAALAKLPEGCRMAGPNDRAAGAALIFVSRRAQIGAELGEIMQRLTGDDPVLWFAYPKAGQLETDITRDRGWDALADAGWRGVRQVAIDDVWAATRFRRAT